MKTHLRKANTTDIPMIWAILKDAIKRRKLDGSQQWQDGYPNIEVVQSDVDNEVGFVFTEKDDIIGCCTLFINYEPLYKDIQGKWLTDGDFIAFHRLAIKETHVGNGLSSRILESIEEYARDNNIYSIKADTNFDNSPMLGLFKKMGYIYCGEINTRGRPRKAFEKVTSRTSATFSSGK